MNVSDVKRYFRALTIINAEICVNINNHTSTIIDPSHVIILKLHDKRIDMRGEYCIEDTLKAIQKLNKDMELKFVKEDDRIKVVFDDGDGEIYIKIKPDYIKEVSNAKFPGLCKKFWVEINIPKLRRILSLFPNTSIVKLRLDRASKNLFIFLYDDTSNIVGKYNYGKVLGIRYSMSVEDNIISSSYNLEMIEEALDVAHIYSAQRGFLSFDREYPLSIKLEEPNLYRVLIAIAPRVLDEEE